MPPIIQIYELDNDETTITSGEATIARIWFNTKTGKLMAFLGGKIVTLFDSSGIISNDVLPDRLKSDIVVN